jgi:hypothetical protein
VGMVTSMRVSSLSLHLPVGRACHPAPTRNQKPVAPRFDGGRAVMVQYHCRGHPIRPGHRLGHQKCAEAFSFVWHSSLSGSKNSTERGSWQAEHGSRSSLALEENGESKQEIDEGRRVGLGVHLVRFIIEMRPDWAGVEVVWFTPTRHTHACTIPQLD